MQTCHHVFILIADMRKLYVKKCWLEIKNQALITQEHGAANAKQRIHTDTKNDTAITTLIE